MKNKLLLIGGKSGSGKSTLIDEALRTFKPLSYLTTYTTRPIRESERAGSNEYVFVSVKEYERLRSQAQDWDHSEIHEHYYGVDVESVRQQLQTTNLILATFPDTELIREMVNRYQVNYRVVFIDVANELLEQRLTSRGDEESVERIPIEEARDTASIQAVSHRVFSPTGDIEADKAAFCKIVKKLLLEV